MKPLNKGLQDIWDNAFDADNYVPHDAEYYRIHQFIAFGAYMVLEGEDANIAWKIRMLCEQALLEVLRETNERILKELGKLQ